MNLLEELCDDMLLELSRYLEYHDLINCGKDVFSEITILIAYINYMDKLILDRNEESDYTDSESEYSESDDDDSDDTN
jgi:hypothetical protein